MNRPFIGISVFGRGGSAGPNGAPSNLTLTVLSPTSNKIDWTRGATNEDYAIVQRSDDGGSYFNLVWLAPGTITYTDDTAILGFLHYYRIVLIKGSLYSAYSNAVNNLTGDIITGKVGEWLLNENTGSTATDTGGVNNGTIVGADWTTGKIGSALSFDGVAGNDVVKLGDILDTTFAGANKKFTISAWIKPGANNLTSNFIVVKYFSGTGGQRQFYFGVTTGQKLRFTWYGALDGSTVRGYTGTLTSITDITKWYHVLVTYDGTNATINSRVIIYIDGVVEPLTVDISTGTPSEIPNGTAQLAIGATHFGDDHTANNFNGLIDSVRVFNRILTYVDILSNKYANYPTPLNSAKLYAYDAGAQEDTFLDSLYLSSNIGLQAKINKPVKYSGNPLTLSGVPNTTWDADKYYPTVIPVAGTYYLWYSSFPDAGAPPYLTAYATSADGLSFVKPNLGLITHESNTDNNLIFDLGAYASSVYYDAAGDADKKYICSLANYPEAGGDWNSQGALHRSVNIYKSPDRINWTLIKQLQPAATPYLEGAGIVKRADGKWIAYYILSGLVDTRQVGAFLSDSTDLTGTWTDQGVIIPTTLSTDQKYGIVSPTLIDGLYYGFIANFNSTTNLIFVDLYASRDGLSWKKKYSNFISLGLSGQWDDSMLFPASASLIQVGNDWRIYYTGTTENHAHAVPRNAKIGFATVGYKRIANIEGSGTLITTAFTPTEPLMINADLTQGTLKVELLLAADNSVIAGYSKDDMDALSGDTYSTEVKWQGNSIPTDTSIKLKFYLT